MVTLERIRLVHGKMVRIEQILAKPRFQRGLLHWFNSSGLKQQLEELRQQRFHLASVYLMAHDTEFASLAQENLSLLKGDRIYFKVQSSTFHVLHSYARHFEGKILDNGHAYCHTTRGNNPVNPFASMMYPSLLRGKVDCYGNIRLSTESTGMAVITTLPKSFEGSIDDAGNMVVRVLERETDFLANGQTMIDKLIANLLGGDRNRLRTFVSNRDALVSSVDALIAKL